MADYVPAWIEIGGPVLRKLVPELVDCIQSHGLSDVFGGGTVEPETAGDLLALARDEEAKSGTLKLYDDRAHNGEFDMLECFLEEQGLAFNRHGDGGAEFSPEVVRFRPGWPAPTITLSDGCGHEMIPTEYIIEALQMLRANKKAKAIKHLAELVNEGVPPLEPFEIVG